MSNQYTLFSEAMRAGIAVTEPIHGHFISVDRCQTCAVGAAVLAVGAEYQHSGSYVGIDWDVMNRVFPYMSYGSVSCSECGMGNCPPWVIASHLFESHHYSRERVAEWVEQLEEKLGLFTTVGVEQPVEQKEYVTV